MLLSLLHVLLGLLPALALGAAARLPRDLFFFTAMACCLPNCGNLPWLFMPALIRYFTPPAQAEQQVRCFFWLERESSALSFFFKCFWLSQSDSRRTLRATPFNHLGVLSAATP